MFVDLEKAFDRVLKKVICFALSLTSVPSYLADGVITVIKVVKLCTQLT